MTPSDKIIKISNSLFARFPNPNPKNERRSYFHIYSIHKSSGILPSGMKFQFYIKSQLPFRGYVGRDAVSKKAFVIEKISNVNPRANFVGASWQVV